MKTFTNIGGNDLPTFLLTATEMIPVELFTVTLNNGQVLRFTPWDNLITVLGVTFSKGPPYFERGNIEETVGSTVSNMDFVIKANDTDLVNGVSLVQSVIRGDWDGAVVLLERVFLDFSLDQKGKLTRWFGELGDVSEVLQNKVTFSAKAMINRLNKKLPRNIIQPTCIHVLFDQGNSIASGCNLNKASFAAAGTIQSGSTVNKILSLHSNTTGYFDLGTVTFTSGLLNGLSYSVRQFTFNGVNGIFLLDRPMIAAPAPGDTFNAYPGCDLTQATCQNKFNNLANFLAFPYVPVPETAL